MASKDSSIIIVGAGVFGLSTAYHLLQQGYTNISIYDRTDYSETKYNPFLGSDAASGDINKFFRLYYENKTYYSRFAIKALDTWEKWNEDIQNLSEEDKKKFVDDDLELIRHTGGLRINNTKTTSEIEKVNLQGFETLGLRSTQYDVQDPKDLERAKLTGWSRKLFVVNDFLKRQKVEHVSGTLDSTSRMLKADKACFYVYLLLSKSKHVKIYSGSEGTFSDFLYDKEAPSKVIGIRTEDGEEHESDLVVLASGPWTTSLLSDLRHRTQASLANVAYVKIPKERQDLIDKYSEYPHTQWKTTSSENDRNVGYSPISGGFTLFPPTKKEGILKINARQIKYLNPEKLPNSEEYVSVPKTVRSSPSEDRLPKSVIEEVKEAILVIAPDLAKVPGVKIESKLYWYTDAINSDFIIDFVPGKENLIVATGGSGHAFKFLPVIGGVVADVIGGNENEYRKYFKWRNPEDNRVDNYRLNQTNIEEDDERNFNKAELNDDKYTVFTPEDLAKINSLKLR